jgi:hypothetical protein
MKERFRELLCDLRDPDAFAGKGAVDFVALGESNRPGLRKSLRGIMCHIADEIEAILEEDDGVRKTT